MHCPRPQHTEKKQTAEAHSGSVIGNSRPVLQSAQRAYYGVFSSHVWGFFHNLQGSSCNAWKGFPLEICTFLGRGKEGK